MLVRGFCFHSMRKISLVNPWKFVNTPYFSFSFSRENIQEVYFYLFINTLNNKITVFHFFNYRLWSGVALTRFNWTRLYSFTFIFNLHLYVKQLFMSPALLSVLFFSIFLTRRANFLGVLLFYSCMGLTDKNDLTVFCLLVAHLGCRTELKYNLYIVAGCFYSLRLRDYVYCWIKAIMILSWCASLV